jgi:hypothetical protein
LCLFTKDTATTTALPNNNCNKTSGEEEHVFPDMLFAQEPTPCYTTTEHEDDNSIVMLEDAIPSIGLEADQQFTQSNSPSDPTGHYGGIDSSFLWSILPNSSTGGEHDDNNYCAPTATDTAVHAYNGGIANNNHREQELVTATHDNAMNLLNSPQRSIVEDELFGLERYTCEEKAHIDLLQTLRDLKAPLKTFDTILGWVSRAKAIGYNFSCTQPSRETVLKKLYERHNLLDLKPKEKKLLLPYSKKIVNIVYFDAQAVFKSLLSCPILNTDDNLLFEDDNSFTPPRQHPSTRSEITSGRGYRKTYLDLVENPTNEILFPCILAIDKTVRG